MQKVFNVAVDIGRKLPAPAFEVNTNDLKSVKLLITITNGQTLLNLTDTTVRIAIRKPDSHIIFQDCTVKDAESGQVEIILENQAYITPGTHTAEIMCYKGSEVVAVSGTFSYKSTKGIMNDEAVESKSEFTTISNMMKDVQETIDDIRENGTGVDAKARQDIESVTTQLTKNTEQVVVNERALKYYWTPEAQPPARSDIPGYLIDGYNLTADQIVERFIEPYRTENPDYVTRESLGKDQSGTHDIWVYSFTPKNPKREIVISSSLHGNEVTLTISMIRFLHYLINESEKYPLLAQMREEVTIHYIPFANPWGASQKPNRTRYNSRGVDLNRNFGRYWDSFVGAEPFGHDYKGTAPFSEKETQLIRDFMASKSNASFWLDLHNTGETTRDLYVFLPDSYEPKTYEKLTDYFTRGMANPVVKLDRNTAPTLSNYYYHTHKKPASHPEWCDIRFGQRMFDSVEMTKALEWLTAVIVEHYRESLQVTTSSNPVITAGGNYLIEDYFSSGAIAPASITLTTYSLPFGTNTFQVPEDGFITFNGEVVILSGANGCRATVCPGFGQAGLGGFSHIASKWESYSDVPANTRLAIPFFSSYPVRKTQNNIQGVQYGLHAKADNGSYQIARYRGQFEFTPATNGNHTSRQITPVAQV